MNKQPDLDPTDWEAFRATGRQAFDDMVDHLQSIRGRPVWRQAPADILREFETKLPHEGRPLARVLEDFDRSIKPYATGNLHPLFMGWVHGAGTPVGMVAEMLAAGLNANCGGRNHIAIDVERQITRWMAEALDFPANSSGLFVTGTSMANFLGLLIARNRALGDDVRQKGLLHKGAQLTAYASKEAHGCIVNAMELAGVGSAHLRLIDVDGARSMRVDALSAAIAADRKAGLTPFLIVGTAGSVNTGAIDPLDAIADVAQAEGLPFHIDGAFGALAALSPALKPLLKGIERADSVACDFHKWGQVPYDAGFLLVRDGQAHRRAFASSAAYLTRAETGLAAGETWPCDLGPDLSRGFRALKTWFTLQTFGADLLGLCIEQTCEVARHLEAHLRSSTDFRVVAPVALNIVCFSVTGENAGARNRALVEHLHASGEAAPSLTILDGEPTIRCAIVNHRTTPQDMQDFSAILHSAVTAIA